MNFWFPLGVLLTITAFYLGLSVFIVLRLLSQSFFKRRKTATTSPKVAPTIAATLLH